MIVVCAEDSKIHRWRKLPDSGYWAGESGSMGIWVVTINRSRAYEPPISGYCNEPTAASRLYIYPPHETRLSRESFTAFSLEYARKRLFEGT